MEGTPPLRGLDLVSQYQDPDRLFLQHQQEGIAAPQLSLPLQGAAFADGVVAARQVKDMVGAGGPQSTVVLRVDWTAPGGRLLLRFDPATVCADDYRALSLRIGQSNEANNAANRDQDSILVV